MTTIAANARTSSTWFDTALSALLAICAGARHGRDIDQRYHALARRSGADLARLGLTRSEIARVALTGRRH